MDYFEKGQCITGGVGLSDFVAKKLCRLVLIGNGFISTLFRSARSLYVNNIITKSI